MKLGRTYGAVMLIAAAFLILGLYSISSNSLTFDEPAYISHGIAQLQIADFDIGKGNPPLLKYLIGALPFAAGLRLPAEYEVGFDKEDALEYQLLFGSDLPYSDVILLARLPILILALLTGLLVFEWSRKLYGNAAGAFAFLLFALNPVILGHGSLASLDMGVTFFIFLAAYLFWRFWKSPSSRNLVLLGIATGLGIASKMAGAHLIAIYLFLLVIASVKKIRMPKVEIIRKYGGWKNAILLLAVVALIAGATVLAAYQFRMGPVYPKGIEKYVPNAGVFDDRTQIGRAVHYALEELTVPFNYYLRDIALQALHQKGPQSNYIFGEMHSSGIWYYYIVAIFLKSPIPLLLFLLLSLLSLKIMPFKFDEWFLLIPLLFTLLYFSFLVPINTGIRYVLQLFPFLFVLCSRFLHPKILNKISWGRFLKGAVLLLSLWYIWAAVSAAPHFLQYFNEFAGGPNEGYRYLSQSDLDWGQADFALKEYIQKNRIQKIKYSYAGSVPPEFYGISYELLPSGFGRGGEDCSPRKGLMAVSATNLNGNLFRNKDCYAWLRGREPIAKVAHVIFVYDLK